MSHAWPTAKLGEVLWHRKEFITIDDVTSYRRPRVQLHVKGIVLRDDIPGALIKTKTQQVCRAGEFLVAEIDAKVGGFGIVPELLDGSIVSSHYFLFVVHEAKLDRRFLDFFIRTPAFREQVAAQGSTNYAAIRPSHVLGYEIPLPPLAAQLRVVTRIEELAAQTYEARRLRKDAEVGAKALLQAAKRMILSSGKETTRPKLHEIAELRYGISAPISNAIDPALGQPIVRMANVSIDGDLDLVDMRYIPASAAEQDKFRLQRGDLLLNWRSGSPQHVGKTAIFDRDGDYLFASFLLRIRSVRDKVLPEFLKLTLNFMRAEGVFLAAQRFQVNTKLNASEFGEFEISVPPLPEQRRILAELDALQAEVDVLKRLQAETAAELDALLPAILDKAFKGEL
jgi:type I restriction enzyme S subunit